MHGAPRRASRPRARRVCAAPPLLLLDRQTYTDLPSVATTPVCRPLNNTLSPELSTIILTVDNGGSGGATSGAEAAAALLNSLAIALAALAGGSLVL